MTPAEDEATSWALAHVYAEDRANAAMHLAAVKFSPITFRLAEVRAAAGKSDACIEDVLSHKGLYEEDPGR